MQPYLYQLNWTSRGRHTTPVLVTFKTQLCHDHKSPTKAHEKPVYLSLQSVKCY